LAATKLRIKDVVNGSLDGVEGSRSKLLTHFGHHDEVRVCGTVMSRFISDDEKYGNLLLDDGSESIQAKLWRADVSKISSFEQGNFIDMVAQVREYNDEKYLYPIHMFLSDVHAWIKFQLQVALSIKSLDDSGKWEHTKTPDLSYPEEKADNGTSKDIENGIDDSFEEDDIVFDDDEINKAVIGALEDAVLSKEEIINKTSLDEIDVMLSLKELLESGDIFEVEGKYKKL